jgi:hypothetical protein
MGRSLHLHIDRRRMVVLGAGGAFLVIAIVFGALAYFQTIPTPGGFKNVSVPATATYTASVTPSVSIPVSTPVGGTEPASTSVPIPTSVVVTVTSTRIVSVPQASAGSSLGAIESGASTLSTVVAAACAVVALRPRGRRAPPTPPASAAATDAPANAPSA